MAALPFHTVLRGRCLSVNGELVERRTDFGCAALATAEYQVGEDQDYSGKHDEYDDDQRHPVAPRLKDVAQGIADPWYSVADDGQPGFFHTGGRR